MRLLSSLLIASLLCLSFVSLASSELDLSNQELVFEDNFDNASATIESYNYELKDELNNVQKWRIDDSKLIADDFIREAGHMIYIINNQTYTKNYTVIVDVYREEYYAGEVSAGIIFGYKNNSDYYRFFSSGKQTWLGRVKDTYARDGLFRYHNIFRNQKDYNVSDYTTMQVSVSEDRVQIYYDGELVVDIEEDVQPGKIGLYSWDPTDKDSGTDAETYFDNLKIYQTPQVITESSEENYTANVNSEAPIKSIDFIVEEEIKEISVADRTGVTKENITETILQSNKTEFNEKDNVTSVEINNVYSGDRRSSGNIVVKIYYIVTDWFGGLFRSNEIKI